MRSFINYIGGKSRLARAIAARLPSSGCYCEVFGGAGWVLFAREPSPVEVLNDADGRLVNLYRVVQERPAALARALSRLPRSRALYRELLAAAPAADEVADAAAYYYLLKSAFSGKVGCGFSASKKFPPKYAMVNDFGAWAARLNKVTVENLGYAACLARYDGADTVFYLDPPYIGTERYYGGAFGPADHDGLREALAGLAARWALSYNDCAEVRERYRGFRMERFAAPYSAARVAAGGRRRAPVAEVLVTNY